MPIELLGSSQPIKQRVPVQTHLQRAVGLLGNAHVVDQVQGARHRRGRGGFAGAQAEHAVFQARAVGVVDQRHLALGVLGVDVFGIPLRQVEFALRVEQLHVGVPVLGVAQFGLAVEELLDLVLQLRIHHFTSRRLRARWSKPLSRNRCQLRCWLTYKPSWVNSVPVMAG